MNPDRVVVQAKTWWKSNTIRLGVGIVILGILEMLQTMELPPTALVLIGAAVVVLRAVTNRPVTMSMSHRRVQVNEMVTPDP